MKEIIKRLRDEIYRAVGKSIREKTIGIAFSGGLDSSLLAKVCEDLGKEVTLLTVGFPNSIDIENSKEVGREMGLSLLIKTIDENFESDLRKVVSLLNPSPIDLEICMAVYYILKLAKENGIKSIATAMGLDELFCGYDRYRRILKDGEVEVNKEIKTSIQNALRQKKQHEVIAKYFGVEKIDPFLERDFINFTLSIPISLKITDPNDKIRKHILRELALEIGVPTKAALRRKKAIQFGSGIHRMIKKYGKKI